MKLKYIVLTSTLLFADYSLAGWFSSKVQISEQPLVDIGETKQGATDGEYRVIVTGIKSSHGSSEAPDLSRAAMGELSRIIQESGAQQVNIDRSVRDKLIDEFERYEAQGISNYTPSEAANLAINGEITSAIITPRYVAEPRKFDAKTKEMVNAPAECVYTAQVQGSIVIWGVNPVERQHAAVMDGTDTLTMPAPHGTCAAIQKGRAHNLYLGALKKAMSDAASELKNQMASSGVVVAARKDPKKNVYYYRLSLKPSPGTQPGVKVDFLETQKVAGKNEKFAFSHGKIVCTNVPRYVYVKLESKGAESRIKAGTPVKLQFSESMLEKLGKGLKLPKIPGFGCDS